MITLPNYAITETIYADNKISIFRGHRQSDETPVILKTLNTEYPTPKELAQIRHEYEIIKELHLNGSVQAYGLEKYGNNLILVLEDVGGDSLRNIIADKRINLVTFLTIAMQLANAVGELHQYNIIHKDLKPSNIIVNLATDSIKITDFSISIRVSPEQGMQSAPFHDNKLEGTLAYISPEQTGRMDLKLDYRTDFYSLGVSFYEMLVGWLPFQSNDPMELVHCHIAKIPMSPNALNPEIPKPISDIIMKLLAKNPDERYQSAYGLYADLQNCYQQLKNNHKIQEFELGTQDMADKFRLPQKIYGRDKEVVILLNTFEYATQGHRVVVFVHGEAGMGKTALVQSLQKSILRKHGFFVSGKFTDFTNEDNEGQNLPYSGIIQALRELILQILTETTSQINVWQQKLLSALGNNGQVIIEVIPELEMLIGKQPEVINLNPKDSSHRFQMIFQKFINVFAQSDHPLVLFLDDLQWADNNSFNLLYHTMTDNQTSSLLLVGGYRLIENYHQNLNQFVDKIKRSDTRAEHLSLSALKLADINQLVADTLHCTLEYARGLAELIFSKTEGNPFFVYEFLKNIYQERLLTFNQEEKRWQWDVKKILEMDMTDNVIAVTGRRMQKLPQTTQTALKLAACIGTQFDLQTLSRLFQHSEKETLDILTEAVEENLILPIGEAYHALYDPVATPETVDFLHLNYRFVHDRVQQAAYSLMSEAEKQQVHYQLGKELRESTTHGHLEERLFDIVKHLNLGIGMLETEGERYDLARLNLAVGKKAKAASAHESALNYFLTGLSLLPQNSWEKQYQLTLNLHIQSMEGEYLNRHFQRAESLFQRVLYCATSLLDQVKAYELKILYFIAQNQMQKALDMGKEVLKLLKIDLPPENARLEDLFSELKQLLKGQEIEQLVDLPPMKDPYKLAALRILVDMSAPAYLTAPTLYPLICFTEVKLCVQYGNSDLSAYAYATYSMILCGILNDIDSGYRFGQVGLKLLEKYENKEINAKVLMLVNVCARHCKEPARQTLEPLLIAVQSGLESGDIEYACYAAMFHITYLFLTGEVLDSVEQRCAQAVESMEKFKQHYQLHYTRIWHQLIKNLKNTQQMSCQLIGEECDEQVEIPLLKEQSNVVSLFAIYFCKALLCYFFKEYEEALKNAEQAEQHLIGGNAFFHYANYKFYYSLILLARYPEVDSKTGEKYLQQVQKNQVQLRHWSKHAPNNYQHKYYLIRAEQARIMQQTRAAMTAYDRAIQGAKTEGVIQEEALANELAAEFYLKLDLPKIAQMYLLDAHYAYLNWGAVAKVRLLEKSHPSLIQRSKHKLGDKDTATNRSMTLSSITLQGTNNFDLITIMKSSQAISGEIVLEKLTPKLLHIVIENVGAQRGVLLLVNNGQLTIEAEADTQESSAKPDTQVVRQAILLENFENEKDMPLPISLINYVVRTKNYLVLNDASHNDMFTNDPYIMHWQPKSILCNPLLNKGELIGILYLENNLMTNAFTSERLTVLRLLSSQIAISIENAFFYEKLQQAREAAETANKAKSTFLMNMSHELRTPLNAILGYAEILHEDAKDMGYEDISPDLDKIQTAGKQLLEILSNVLDISKIEADKMGLNLVVFEVTDLIADVVTVIQPSVGNNQLEVIKGDDLGKMYADQTKTQQIMLNLLSNAVKFTDNGTITFSIHRHQAHPEQGNTSYDWLLFEVADTGIGMTEEEIARVFEAFTQVDNSTTRQYGGTGLGLTISEHFCRMMGGKITVSSELNKNSVFQVQLPAQVVDK